MISLSLFFIISAYEPIDREARELIVSSLPLIQRNKTEEASFLLLKALKISKSKQDKRKAAELLVAEEGMYLEHQIEALLFLTENFSQDPAWKEWAYKLGGTYFDLEKLNLAEIWLKRARQKKLDLVLLDFKLGFILWNQNKFKEAYGEFKKALRTTDPEIKKMMARDLSRLGLSQSNERFKNFAHAFDQEKMEWMIDESESTLLQLKWLKLLTEEKGEKDPYVQSLLQKVLKTPEPAFQNIQNLLLSLQNLRTETIPSQFSEEFIAAFDSWNQKVSNSLANKRNIPPSVLNALNPFIKTELEESLAWMTIQIAALKYEGEGKSAFERKKRKIIADLKKTYL